MSERRDRVNLYSGELTAENRVELVAWLAPVVETAPEACREDVVVEINAVGGFRGAPYATVDVYYYQQETDRGYENMTKQTLVPPDYLGDGVYVSDEGYAIAVRINDHRTDARSTPGARRFRRAGPVFGKV